VGLGIIRFFLRIQLRRSIIIFLISAIALPGLRPFGQVRVQLSMDALPDAETARRREG
jgi:hypothetical protein